MPIQHWSDQVWIIEPAGDAGLREDIESLIRDDEAGEPRGLVLDLASVGHVTSSDLSLMLRLRKQVLDRDGHLRLVGPNEAVRSIFKATALDQVFTFNADTTTALAELQLAL